jgi:hypothetical protein
MASVHLTTVAFATYYSAVQAYTNTKHHLSSFVVEYASHGRRTALAMTQLLWSDILYLLSGVAIKISQR